MNQDSK